MAFDRDDQLIQSVLDSGFLPPHPEALASVINAISISRARERPDTLDGLLLEVLMTFNNLASEIISAPENPQAPRSITVPFSAAWHTLAIADLLTFLSEHAQNCCPANETPGAKEEIRARWIDAIVRLCRGEEDRPWHLSPNGYVALTGFQLVSSIEAFRGNPRVSLDPDDPIIGVEPLLPPQEGPMDPDIAARDSVWRAAAAICIAACVCPEFRFGLQPSRS